MTRKTITQLADDSVRWTGIPRLVIDGPENRRRRHLRILPIVTLTIATVGIVLILANRKSDWPGYALLMAGFAVGNFLPIFGPVKAWGDRADERDRQVRHNAYFATLAMISAVAIFGLYGITALALLQHWDVAQLVGVIGIVPFYLMALWSSVPTLHASWATRPLDLDDA